MGGGKPFRILAGKPLIERALDQARRWSQHPVIAVRGPAPFAGLAVPLIHDDPDMLGPIAGLIAGAAFATEQGADLLLTIAADTPFLPRDLLDRLCGALGEANGAAIASSGGQLHPVSALWRIAALASAGDYVRSGRRSLLGLSEAIGRAIVDWPVEPFDPFFNVNDAEDLAVAEQLLAQKVSTSTDSPAA